MDIASLVIAIVASIAAAASVVYSRLQVREMGRQLAETKRQFELSGPMIEVEAKVGIPFGPVGTSAIQLGVKVTNRGRGASSIQSWGFSVDDGEGKPIGDVIGPLQVGTIGPPMPHLLQGLHSESWMMDRELLREGVLAKSGRFVRPFADLGDGTRVTGERLDLSHR